MNMFITHASKGFSISTGLITVCGVSQLDMFTEAQRYYSNPKSGDEFPIDVASGRPSEVNCPQCKEHPTYSFWLLENTTL